jgi:predicted ATPase
MSSLSCRLKFRTGTGKTSLALTLSHETKFFIHGKFDQLQNPSPYYVLVQAVSDFVRENGEAREVASIRMAAQSVLDPAEIAILLDSIPELEIIFGAFSEVKPTQITRQNGFVFAFCKFIGSLCTGDHPLVLFLDDLQWSDAGSLEILKALTRDPAIQEGLFLLACVRGNEVGMDDPLSLMLRSLDEDDIPIIEIRVPNLSQETIRELISELIDVAEAENENLASFVHEFTRGNAFFVIQFLRSLFEEQLVTRKDGYWVWNEFSITQLFPRNDIIEFLKVKLEKCSSEMQELLKIVSCLGTEIEVNLISYLVSKEETETLLDEAIGKELLSRHNSCVYFTHDCIQLAALSLIAPENKAEFHLFLGQQLFVRMDPEEIQQNLFLVTNQLCLGSSAMYDPEEKNSLAELCPCAGKRASKVSSFDTAAIYLDIGINMLGNRRWRDEYDLSLDLYGSMAEVACSQGDYARVDELLQEILENSRSLHEKLRALTIQVYSLGSRNEHQEAIDKGVEVLKLLGLKFPKKSRMIHILMSMMKTKRMLRGRSDEQILSMPIIQCEDRLAALRLLNIVFLYAFMSRPTFSPLITMTSVQLSIRYGLSDMLCTAMGNYAVLLCAVGDVDAGLRYSELSLKLLARFDAKQWLGRVYCSAYAIVYPWKHPLRGSLMPLKRAQRSALATGDIEVSYDCLTLLISSYRVHNPRPRSIR